MQKTILLLFLSMNVLSANQLCNNYIHDLNVATAQMKSYMNNGYKGLDLYMAAKRSRSASMGIIKECNFSKEMVEGYERAIAFSEKVMHDEMNK